MKRVIFDGALLLTVCVFVPGALYAQEDGMMSFSEEEATAGQEAPPAEQGATPAEGEEAAATPPAEGEAPAEGEKTEEGLAGGVSEADVLGALGETPTGGAAAGTGAAGETASIDDSAKHPIWAVQQVYVLRKGRVDLQPSFALSMNDPYRQHQAINLGAAYYITEVLGVGVSFNFYRWLGAETDVNFQVSRATHQNVPINEYFWGGQLNFTYVPIYGKFAMFKQWILHWDVWVLGGGGFVYTRPIAVIDPAFRDFDFSIKFCFNVGIGGRLFLTRFAAIYLELRDYIFPEELENLQSFYTDEERANKDNWLDEDYKLTNNVMLTVGVSLFIPFTFDYELPK